MSGRLEGKVALITGGSSGMGASHARGFVAQGAKVVIGDIADDAGAALAAELGDAAVFTHLDVTNPADWSAAVEIAERSFGKMNVLVNNAGILSGGTLDEFTPEQWDLAMAINAKSCFLGLKASLNALRRAQPSSVVNISSGAGLQGIAGMHAYTASKFAVRGFTKSAALELAGQGIRVNSVHPGNVNTPMTQGYAAAAGVSSDDLRAREKSSLTRAADPSEITALVLFLASDESSFSTGAEFIADGGTTAGVVF
ncbi:SDR family oxidoreductase [Pseudarthrobacter sp. NPDC058119]|uniref:SDR family oxidoreductase n=1 Tax=Pseudarthrobacter sp. NPDC058119 TaxID=3346348 RepID=UPI0036DC72A6